jgi:hypothetical protein
MRPIKVGIIAAPKKSQNQKHITTNRVVSEKGIEIDTPKAKTEQTTQNLIA